MLLLVCLDHREASGEPRYHLRCVLVHFYVNRLFHIVRVVYQTFSSGQALVGDSLEQFALAIVTADAPHATTPKVNPECVGGKRRMFTEAPTANQLSGDNVSSEV